MMKTIRILLLLPIAVYLSQFVAEKRAIAQPPSVSRPIVQKVIVPPVFYGPVPSVNRYLTLGRQTPQAGTRRVLNARSYAYGWFGATPRRQPHRTFGYYGAYTQWQWK